MFFYLSDETEIGVDQVFTFFRDCGLQFQPVERTRYKESEFCVQNFLRFANLNRGPNRLTKLIDAGELALIEDDRGVVCGRISWNRTAGAQFQFLTLAHEIAHAIDGLLLGNGIGFGTLGSFGAIPDDVRTAIVNLRHKLRETKRYRVWNKVRTIAQLERIAVKGSYWQFYPEAFAYWTFVLKFAVFRIKADTYSIEFGDIAEIFADTLLVYLTTFHRDPQEDAPVCFNRLHSRLNYEAWLIRQEFVKNDPESFDVDKFRLMISSDEIRSMKGELDTIWNFICEKSRNDYERLQN